MHKIDKNVEKVMDIYLSSVLGITERGVRKIKRDNPDRYRRELVGALVLGSGISFGEIICHFNKNKYLQVLDRDAKEKIAAIQVLTTSTPVFGENIRPKEVFTFSHAEFIQEFLCGYFKGYYSELGGGLSFLFSAWTRNGSELYPVMDVMIVDATCGNGEFIQKEEFVIVDKDMSILPLNEIIKNIIKSKIFKGFHKKEIIKYKNTFDLKFKKINNPKCDEDNPPMSMEYSIGNWTIVEKEEYVIPKYIQDQDSPDTNSGYDGVIYSTRLIKHKDEIYDVNGGDATKDRERELKTLLSFCEYAGCGEDEGVKVLKAKALREIELFKSNPELEKKRDRQINFYLFRLEELLLDSISKGLCSAHGVLVGTFLRRGEAFFEKLEVDKEGYYILRNQKTKTAACGDLYGCNKPNLGVEKDAEEEV